jgi:hypothetical protein
MEKEGGVMTDETGQTGQTATPQPTVPRSWPWSMFVALFAIGAVSVGAVWVLVEYKTIFQAPTDVTTLMGSWFTVVGTIVGAYFGIKTSSDTTAQVQGTIQMANNTANQALGALNPSDAARVLQQPTTQGQSSTAQ